MLLDGVRWALGTHILIKVKLLMWNCSEDEFAFTDRDTDAVSGFGWSFKEQT